MSFKTIGIHGLGLLGGSLGMAIKAGRTKIKVIGFARRKWSIRTAIKQKAIDQGFIGLDYKAAIEECDLIVLCVPIRSIIQSFPVIRKNAREGLVIIDVGSTKEDIVKTADKVFKRAGMFFVGCHPMAGSEKSGLEFSRKDLFRNALCLVTPGSSSNAKSVKGVKEFWKSLGSKVRMSAPDMHDRIIARVSHFPHLVSAALIDSIREDYLDYSGTGLRDMTRIAGSDSGLWKEILFSNVESVKKAHSEFEKRLKKMINLLDKKHESRFASMFHEASEKRKRMG